jgi:hypothetical protein
MVTGRLIGINGKHRPRRAKRGKGEAVSAIEARSAERKLKPEGVGY